MFFVFWTYTVISAHIWQAGGNFVALPKFLLVTDVRSQMKWSKQQIQSLTAYQR